MKHDGRTTLQLFGVCYEQGLRASCRLWMANDSLYKNNLLKQVKTCKNRHVALSIHRYKRIGCRLSDQCFSINH